MANSFSADDASSVRPSGTPGRAMVAPVQGAAWAVSAVFLLVGIAGFIPGITSHYDLLSFAGHESGALLLGIFAVSVLHNLVHLLFGIVGFGLARTSSGARGYLIGGGVVYLLLWVYGLIVDHHGTANFVPVNNADNWLHLGLGIGMIALGVLTTRRVSGDEHRLAPPAPDSR